MTFKTLGLFAITIMTAASTHVATAQDDTKMWLNATTPPPAVGMPEFCYRINVAARRLDSASIDYLVANFDDFVAREFAENIRRTNLIADDLEALILQKYIYSLVCR